MKFDKKLHALLADLEKADASRGDVRDRIMAMIGERYGVVVVDFEV